MTAALVFLGSRATAEPWSIEPLLGASAEYDTNPGLEEFQPASEGHVAALFNLPLRYDTDGFEFKLVPSGRIGNNRGYAALGSDYEHLDSSAQLVGDRQTLTVQGELARDSSLYHGGGPTNGIGARRDTEVGAAEWTDSLTERSRGQLDVNWSQIRYDSPGFTPFLVNYRYLSGGPAFSFEASERSTLTTSANYGRYQSLDGATESKSQNLQLTFVRRLTEIWSLNGSAGYARSMNSSKEYFGPFYLGTEEFTQAGTVYSASLTRQGEKLNVNAGYTRALQPSGLAYLSRQDSAFANVTYTLTERWNFGLNAVWQRSLDPVTVGPDVHVRFLNAQLTASWNWTEQWVLSMHLNRVTEQYGPPSYDASSSGVSIDLMRHFPRMGLW